VSRTIKRDARIAGVALLVVLVAAVAGFAAYNAWIGRPAPLEGTFDSPSALGRAVLDAFREGDRGRLRALAMTEDEFRRHVWPELPISRPEVNFPYELAWGQLAQTSALSLEQMAVALEGHAYELVEVKFAGAVTDYAQVTVYRETELLVRGPDGEEETIRVFGSTIEQDGRYKVFSYVVD
jgi:hypothetical protein